MHGNYLETTTCWDIGKGKGKGKGKGIVKVAEDKD